MNDLVSYFRGSFEELRHVQWPTQQQAVRLSLIVLGFIAVSAAAFGLIDFLIGDFIAKTI